LSDFQRLQAAGVAMTPNQITHILDNVGGTFDDLVPKLVQFVTPPFEGGLSAFHELVEIHGVTRDDIARALAGAGNQFNELVANLQQRVADGLPLRNRPIRHRRWPKNVGQADNTPRERFSFDKSQSGISLESKEAVTKVVVVMENDERSKEAARKLCRKSPDKTLCVEWNPDDKDWQAVTAPGGEKINSDSLHIDSQAKMVMVGHFRDDQTIAEQSPEALAVAQVALLEELGIKTPRKISLTGVCYTAPEAGAMEEAADSLAGRFAVKLAEEGVSIPVTAVDGEVIASEQGRKFTMKANAPARENKVQINIEEKTVVVTPSNLRRVSADVVDIAAQRKPEETTQLLNKADEALVTAKGFNPSDCREAKPGDAFLVDAVCELAENAFLYKRHLNRKEREAGNALSAYVRVSAEMRESLGLGAEESVPTTKTGRRRTAVRIPATVTRRRKSETQERSSQNETQSEGKTKSRRKKSGAGV